MPKVRRLGEMEMDKKDYIRVAEHGTKTMPARELFDPADWLKHLNEAEVTGSIRPIAEPDNLSLRLSDSLRADIDRFYRVSVTQEAARNG